MLVVAADLRAAKVETGVLALESLERDLLLHSVDGGRVRCVEARDQGRPRGVRSPDAFNKQDADGSRFYETGYDVRVFISPKIRGESWHYYYYYYG